MASKGTKNARGHQQDDSEGYTSTPVAPLPTDLPVRYQEGDPVEYSAASSNRSYAARLRAKEANGSARGLPPSKPSDRPVGGRSPQDDGRSDSEVKILAAGYWLLSPSERQREDRTENQAKGEARASPVISPYRKTPNSEHLLNVLASKPRSVTSPTKSNQSSPDPRRTPLQEVDRVILLEKKLQESNERCRAIEKQYHDLLARQGETERGGRRGSREEEERLETHVAEETASADPTLASAGSVESLLRQVLDELRDLKVRMTRIEAATARLESSSSSR